MISPLRRVFRPGYDFYQFMKVAAFYIYGLIKIGNMRARLESWLAVKQFAIMRFSLGLIYIWFGFLKFFPHLSPAEDLAKDTIHHLTFGMIPDNVSLTLLASWETIMGVFLIGNLFSGFTLRMLLVHLACTFMPFVFFMDRSFTHLPYAFTLVGQYIAKNVVLVAAALMLISNHRNSQKEKEN